MPPEIRSAVDELPAAVRLPPHRSVFRLGTGARMVGLDPATAVAVEDLPPFLAELLDELTGPMEPAAFIARAAARGVETATAEGLLHDLVEAGVLIDATTVARGARRCATSTVLVVGDGPLAVGIAVGLVHAGVGTVYVEATGPVLADDLGTGYVDADRGHDRCTATRSAVRRLRPEADAGPAPQRAVVDLVVLADALAPASARVARLHAGGTAHLPVRMRDGIGVVGPLVLPGRTACLHCLDLHRQGRDPCWPTVAVQLAGRNGQADPATVAATAALATAQALAVLDPSRCRDATPPTLETTIELDATAGTLERRRWTAQKGCSCGAAGPAPATGGP